MSDTSSTTKIYPSNIPSQMARMLNLHSAGDHQWTDNSIGGLPIANLPVAQNNAKSTDHSLAASVDTHSASSQSTNAHGGHEHLDSAGSGHSASQTTGQSLNATKKAVKAVVPFVVVFSAAVFAYFFYFSKVDLTNLGSKLQVKSDTGSVSVKQTALQQLESKNLTTYKNWINQFYYDVSDSKIIDPESDNSGNGLSNFQKYLLNLNPKTYDTLGLGESDSETLAKGINPNSGQPLSDSQKNILDKYFDMESIINKLTLLRMQKNQGQVAGSTITNQSSNSGLNTNQNPFVNQNSNNNLDQNVNSQNSQGNSGDINLNNQTRSIRGSVYTTSLTNNQTNRQNSAIFANSGSNDYSNLSNNLNFEGSQIVVDQGTPGRLEIPSLNINVPIIWTQNPKNFDKDLQNGVVHYPGTALPGQVGTTYISGHSSNYVWAKGSFNKVFATLGNLSNNASFKITVVDSNKKDVILHYVVTGRKEYAATDQAQFKNSAKSIVALSTCWPVGTTAKRLVITGVLTQIEK